MISPGPDHGNLRRLETLLAGQLAASGFPDPPHSPRSPPGERASRRDRSLEPGSRKPRRPCRRSQTRAACAPSDWSGRSPAAWWPRWLPIRLGSSELALIEPVSRGKRYIRETIRRQAIAEVIASSGRPRERQRRGGGGTRVGPAPAGGSSPPPEKPGSGAFGSRRPSTTGSPPSTCARDMRAFSGRSLLIGISPSGSVPTGTRQAARPPRSARRRRHPRDAGRPPAGPVRRVPLPQRRAHSDRHAARARPAARSSDDRLGSGRSLEAEPTEDAA